MLDTNLTFKEHIVSTESLCTCMSQLAQINHVKHVLLQSYLSMIIIITALVFSKLQMYFIALCLEQHHSI